MGASRARPCFEVFEVFEVFNVFNTIFCLKGYKNAYFLRNISQIYAYISTYIIEIISLFSGRYSFMIWRKISITTTTEAVDLISEFLAEQGVEGIMIEDNQPLTEEEIRAMYIDIPLEMENVDDSAVVSFFLDSSYTDKQIDDLASSIRNELARLSEFIDVGSGDIDMTETSDDTTWNDNFKNYFKPMRLFGDIVIMPVVDDDIQDGDSETENESDFELSESDKVINIKSVMAFGTGTHETTRLCLGLIKKHISDMQFVKEDISMMDVGCGSGILSIASRLLGAGYVHGVDIDPQAVESSKENALANDMLDENMVFSCGNLLAGRVVDGSSDVTLGETSDETANGRQIDDGNVMVAGDKNKIEQASLGSGISSVLTPEEAARMVDIENGTVDPVEKRKYDIVVANILADVIIPLSSVIREYMNDGGVFICSGISDKKIDEVKIALMQNGFTIIDEDIENEWHALAAI